MAVNQSHTENRQGAVIPFGESVLKQCPDVDLSFLQQPAGSDLFRGTKKGTLFLTSYRVIFVTSHSVEDPMFSFMMPFDLMSNCTIEQPVFAPNYIRGTVQAAPDGGWEGQAVFKLSFRKGGAVEFAQLMMKAASAAARGIPLGSVNYWYGTLGLFIITTPGGTACTQHTPCPVVVYGPLPAAHGGQPAEYGAPSAGYRAPPAGYGVPPPGYGAPPPGYGAPPPGYGAPPPGYGAPARYEALPPGYGAPPESHGAPPAGYGAPPPGYEAPSAGYGAPPVGYGAPPAGYGPAPAGNEGLPLAYEVPSAGNRAASHRSVAAHPETSLPSTSSS